MSTSALSFEELASAAKPATATDSQATSVETKTNEATAAVTATATEESKPQFTDADVASYQTMRDLGITLDNAKEFVQAKEWLNTIAFALKNDPAALLAELQRTSPEMADRLREVASDEWYQRKGKFMPGGEVYERDHQSKDGKSNAVTSEPDPRIDQLSREVAELRKESQQKIEGERQVKVEKDFIASFDALAAKLPTDLPEQTRDYIRLKAEKMLWQDPQARARVNSGNFTDVPKYFAEASRRVTAETKAAADKEKTARTGVESRGTKEIPHGTENTSGTAQSQPGQDPIWGNISEQEIAGAYKR